MGARALAPIITNRYTAALVFYGGLGQVASSSITTTHNANYALFSNVQSSEYWSGTEYSASPYVAWYFNTGDGVQDDAYKQYGHYALAVSPGQVSAVPVPGAAWLFGSGVIGLLGMNRRRTTANLKPHRDVD